jgi:hypothetical protein
MADKPSFVFLSDAVDFIARALEAGECDDLLDACVGPSTGIEADVRLLSGGDELSEPMRDLRAYKLSEVHSLAERHRDRSLRTLYEGRTFPQHEDRFTLGGHGRELGYVHIDFLRSTSGWQLENIWMCR